MLRNLGIVLTTLLSSPFSYADKLDASFGFYSVSFSRPTEATSTISTIGSVFLNYRKPAFHHGEIGVGFNMFFPGNITSAPGTGFELSYAHYPFTASDATVDWRDSNVKITVREVWRPFVAATVMQRTYPITTSTKTLSFFGACGSIGTERTIKGDLSLRAELMYGVGAGAGETSTSFLDIKGGLSFRF